MRPSQNVAVVAVPGVRFQRQNRRMVCVTPSAIIAPFGVVLASIMPEVAPVMSANDKSAFVAASCALSVIVPFDANR